MKSFFTLVIFVYLSSVYAISPEQITSLSGSPERFFAPADMEAGTYILKRDIKTPKIVKVEIRKNTKDKTTTSYGGGLTVVNLPGASKLVPMKGKTVTGIRREIKFLELDFSDAKVLSDGEIETVVFTLDFLNDEITIKDVAITSDSSDRYQIEKPGYFDRLDPKEDTYSFVIEE